MPDVLRKHSSVCWCCSCFLAAPGLLCTPAEPVNSAVNQLACMHSYLPGRSMPLRSKLADAYLLSGTVLVTAETPSTNFVRKMTLALLNIPSFRETTTNWE